MIPTKLFSLSEALNRDGILWALALMGVLLSLCSLSHAETTGPEKGVLYIHGGSGFNAGEFVQIVKNASGKAQPVICVITTPQGKRREEGYQQGTPFPLVDAIKNRFGMKHVEELYTLNRKDADKPLFYEMIDRADAVHMSGGNQCFLTDAFLDTKTLAALHRLLGRGGVISGSSAGAQVQSSFMTRGDYTRRRILGDKKHQIGFGFVQNAAFDVHVEERNREKDLLELFRARKSELQDKTLNPLDLLGIGIDQGTAIIVRKNIFQVSGRGQVYIFNPELWGEDPNEWGYETLQSGTAYDMKLRKVVSE